MLSLFPSEAAFNVFDFPGRGVPSTYGTYTYGGEVREIFWQPKNITSASLQPKSVSLLILRYLYLVNDCKSYETVQSEARVASSEPKNIRLTIFLPQNIMANKGRFCHTMASVALVHTSIQSDKRMLTKEMFSPVNQNKQNLKVALNPVGQKLAWCRRRLVI